jgi:AsmA family protein
MNRGRRAIVMGVASLLGLLVILVAAVALLDWNRFKPRIERIASAHLGRPVSLAGPLQVRVLSRAPIFTVNDLTIGGPPWDPGHNLVEVKKLTIELELRALLTAHLVLRRVEVLEPKLYLHLEKSGRANWTFESEAATNGRSSPPAKLPAMHELVMQGGRLELIDEVRRLRVKGSVVARSAEDSGDGEPFELRGTGTINGEPFRLSASGGELASLSPERPYPFKLSIVAGENRISAAGKFLQPFDFGKLDLDLHAQGRDLSELYYLTQIALPNTPPYQLKARLLREGQTVTVKDIAGVVGRSDLRGEVAIDTSHKRAKLKARLVSRQLFLSDLGAVTGSQAGKGASLDKGTPASGSPVSQNPPSSQFVFPDARLQLDRVRGLDAQLDFSATSIEAGGVPFNEVSARVVLESGVLRIDPLRFEMAEGRLQGGILIDARSATPAVHIELRAQEVGLAQLKGKSEKTPAPLEGVLQARLLLNGAGDSVHRFLASSSGSVTAVVPHGDIRAAFAELTGINVAEGLGLLLKKSDARDSIRGGVARFDLKDGVAQADTVVVDTQNVLITGRGSARFSDEALDLTVQGQPKQLRLIRIRAPIKVRGRFRSPSFQVDKGQLLKQGGIAAVLGALVTPFAAMLAFVDPGLAKDQNCAALLAEAAPAAGSSQ